VKRKPNPKKGTSRSARTLRSLVTISVLGIGLAVYNAVSLHRDVAVAVGPAGSSQEDFFRGAADRPDISTFFKNLIPAQRLQMAKNIGRYTDPELAKLCGQCLDTFDPVARVALTDSLGKVAKVHPDAAAVLLKLPGSFQQIAIASALRKAGDFALPLVAKQFADGDARPNAIAFLVATGPHAIGPTLPYLDDTNKDIRLAAADTLGKLRAKPAVEPLTHMFQTSKGDERLAYLTALATIGDPSSQQLMTATLQDETLPTPHRAQAALGLGIIGTESSLQTLWAYATDIDKSLREGAISALQIAGDSALKIGTKESKTKEARSSLLLVAAGVHTKYADSVIEHALVEPSTSAEAAKLAGNRPDLVGMLVAYTHRLDSNTQGDLVDSILKALGTTSEGQAALSAMGTSSQNPSLDALASRRLALSR